MRPPVQWPERALGTPWIYAIERDDICEELGASSTSAVTTDQRKNGSEIATGGSSIAAKDRLVAGAWRCFIFMIGLALACHTQAAQRYARQEAACAIGHRST